MEGSSEKFSALFDEFILKSWLSVDTQLIGIACYRKSIEKIIGCLRD